MTSLSDPRVPGGGAGKQVTLGGTENSSGEPAGLAVTESTLDPRLKPAGETLTVTGVSQQSQQITENKIDITCDTADCWISIGTNPVAAIGSSTRIVAGTVRLPFKVVTGDKIAVIGTAGTMSYHGV